MRAVGENENMTVARCVPKDNRALKYLGRLAFVKQPFQR
jgi:hypothetical protein